MLLRGVASKLQQRSAALESSAQATAAQDKAMREYLERETRRRTSQSMAHRA